MTFAVAWSKPATKSLERLNPRHFQRVDDAVRELAALVNPRIAPGVVKLAAWEPPTWRSRVGDFRILFRVDDAASVLLVVDVVDRKDVYR